MSVWTHVNSAIRINHIRFSGQDHLSFPKAVSFDDIINGADITKCELPYGSEGSLNISVWEHPDISRIACYTVSIFGDLRDFDDEQKIIDFFKKFISDKWIRDASFTVTVSKVGRKKRVFTYTEDEDGDGQFTECFFQGADR